MPERYRKRDQSAEWLRVQKRGATAHSFLEGPAFDRAGNLYVTDIPYGRVFRISPAGDFELVAEYDGEPNGLKVHRDGRIFIADHKHGIMLLDPASGAVVRTWTVPAWSASRASTTCSSRPTATCTSPTRDSPDCRTPAAASIATARRAS